MSHLKRSLARSSGVQLTAQDAALIKGMIARGDRKHDIAALFGVNPGRVAEVNDGTSFGCIPAASTEVLPPPGPYLSGQAANAAMAALAEAQAALAAAEHKIRGA